MKKQQEKKRHKKVEYSKYEILFFIAVAILILMGAGVDFYKHKEAEKHIYLCYTHGMFGHPNNVMGVDTPLCAMKYQEIISDGRGICYNNIDKEKVPDLDIMIYVVTQNPYSDVNYFEVKKQLLDKINKECKEI